MVAALSLGLVSCAKPKPATNEVTGTAVSWTYENRIVSRPSRPATLADPRN
jgi:hypothetical protein